MRQSRPGHVVSTKRGKSPPSEPPCHGHAADQGGDRLGVGNQLFQRGEKPLHYCQVGWATTIFVDAVLLLLTLSCRRGAGARPAWRRGTSETRKRSMLTERAQCGPSMTAY